MNAREYIEMQAQIMRAHEAAEEKARQERSLKADQQRNCARKLPQQILSPVVSLPSHGLKVRLFYNYYDEKDIARKQEIDLCLQENIKNTFFDIIVLSGSNNPTLNFFIQKINQLAGPNDISVFCRSDIFFDESVDLLGKIKYKEIIVLNNYAWAIKGNIDGVDGYFPIDIENRVAHEFQKAGYKINNSHHNLNKNHLYIESLGLEKEESL